jgi:hypothetical protein
MATGVLSNYLVRDSFDLRAAQICATVSVRAATLCGSWKAYAPLLEAAALAISMPFWMPLTVYDAIRKLSF